MHILMDRYGRDGDAELARFYCHNAVFYKLNYCFQTASDMKMLPIPQYNAITRALLEINRRCDVFLKKLIPNC